MDITTVLPDGSPKTITFKELLKKSKFTVLYFYPKDNTSWCTLEAQEFTWLVDKFTELDTQIVWVSKDSAKSHCNFIEKHNIKYNLITDPDLILHNQFEVIWEKKMYGKVYQWTVRSTFILDQNWKIIKERKNVKARWHADSVLEYLQSL